MSETVQTAIFEMLKRMQADLADVRGRVTKLEPLVADMAEFKARVGKLEDHASRQPRNEAGVLVMMRGTAGLFDERVSRLEADVAALKSERLMVRVAHAAG